METIPQVKICGVTTDEVLRFSVEAGANYIGFVHYPNSPRYIAPQAAKMLRGNLPPYVKAVSVVVDADDETLAHITGHVVPDMLQLHGNEMPGRVKEIRERFGIPVMKAIPVEVRSDLSFMDVFGKASDMLLFDTKPPKDSALPGGNGESFDWRILRGAGISKPWMLSGGLNNDNVANAMKVSRAQIVDVSSGVESAPGVKDLKKIAEFIRTVQTQSTRTVAAHDGF